MSLNIICLLIVFSLPFKNVRHSQPLGHTNTVINWILSMGFTSLTPDLYLLVLKNILFYLFSNLLWNIEFEDLHLVALFAIPQVAKSPET